MARYEINGGHPLNGTVTISGAKNAAVAILPAALLVSGKCRIENVPNISDVRILMSILDGMGAKIVTPEPGVVEIDCTDIHCSEPDQQLVRRMRASYYLMGALLGRFGRAHVALPGGCNFASRPIDQHIKGFLALGADVDETEEYVALTPGQEGLHGGRISLDMASVGATVNIMLAATLLPGQTIIENAAKEPHIVDLANFLNSMGADIKGAGTDSIKIRGVKRLTGGSYGIIPDQIEAGTYMAAVAATGGQLLLKNVIPKHMECISAKLMEMGVSVTEGDDSLLVRRSGPLTKTNVKTLPYPGFPTDMQPQITAVLALAGCSFGGSGGGGTTVQKIDRPAVESAEEQFTHPAAGDTVAVFDTSAGVFKAVLFPDKAPQAYDNFTGLVQQGYYNGLTVSRVESGFVVEAGQGTDGKGTTIWSGSRYPAETTDSLHHYSGALCMGVDASGECASVFYVVQTLPGDQSVTQELVDKMNASGYRAEVVAAYQTVGGAPYLDYTDTVFGQVYEGMDVVDAMAQTAVDENQKPTEAITIHSVSIETYQ